ncbi:MAG TPA: aromatic ring-hydroxylating dioxygenase subunit alpha [Chloroflexota bacterium]|jgi:5,5'-dehydrodivanillate O-demethylase|nr:aromatic ring-hydroxylating dioxygenase subunit alpha [Chloroflexota bacterium]
MLTEEQNRALTQVGPGTLMGELLRRYWMPIAAVAELDDAPIKPVRLLGEDLVLYKDLTGTYGLIERHCPHRRADLSYGFVEECGLRCNYHGWLFDEQGRCLEQPFEEVAHPTARFKDRIRVKAYRVEAKAGLLWAYLGPEPAPLVPTWEPFTWPNGFVQIVFAEIPCNWFQCQENSIDPVHFEWLHSNWSRVLAGRQGPRPPTHLKIAFDEFEYGFRYRRILEGQRADDELWTVGRVCLWPNALFTGTHFEWRVPIDDTHTLSVAWFIHRVPREREPYHQERIPYWYGPIQDPRTGRWITSHIMNQDFVAWMGQGTIADRTREHLGESDRGIILMRRRMLEEAQRVAAGGEPKGLVRDPEQNRCIRLPIIDRDRWLAGYSLAELATTQEPPGRALYPKEFPFQAEQPEAVRRAYWEAMGLPERAAAPPPAAPAVLAPPAGRRGNGAS